jgi:RNA polymerase sigma-70 factor, ECF subfamily
MILSTVVPQWSQLGGAELAGDDASAADARVQRVEQIVARHIDSIWRTARDLGVLPRDLEDVVQEVLVVCVRRIDDIDPARERAFLLATTARVVANWRRTRRRRPAEPFEFVDELGSEGLEPHAQPTGPAEALERKRELALVQSALDEMTEPQRVAFTLFELEELTAREIAEQLGVSEPVVFARVQRARAVFQRYLARVRPPHDPADKRRPG